MPSATVNPRIADIFSGAWQEHTRFQRVLYKVLLTSADNCHASVNAVQVPPGGVIDSHNHPAGIETVFAISGNSTLQLGGNEQSFRAGQIVSIPIGMSHSLQNTGLCTVELLTIFTPALT
jgi:quercetin dioxygenase-like cupin family protein